MVKRYFRLSIDSIVLQIATLSFIVGCVYFSSLCTIAIISQASRDNNEWVAVFATAVLYFGTLLFVYVELTFLIGNICLGTDHISVRGDIKIGREKIQYPASIGYGDIVNIEIIPLRKKF